MNTMYTVEDKGAYKEVTFTNEGQTQIRELFYLNLFTFQTPIISNYLKIHLNLYFHLNSPINILDDIYL